MEMQSKLFIHKYQPIYFNDFGMDSEILNILKMLIQMDNLNILFIACLIVFLILVQLFHLFATLLSE